MSGLFGWTQESGDMQRSLLGSFQLADRAHVLSRHGQRLAVFDRKLSATAFACSILIHQQSVLQNRQGLNSAEYARRDTDYNVTSVVKLTKWIALPKKRFLQRSRLNRETAA
jgi:hypothetical protein